MGPRPARYREFLYGKTNYLGSTFMPMVFGKLQQAVGIWIMPLYLTLFAFMNIAFLEWTYRKIGREGDHT